MTNEQTIDTPKGTIRFFWWCRQCGWWCEVDLSGLCSDCRHDSDRRRHGATPDDVDKLKACRKCRI
jgi:hypothetical protein